MAEKNKRKISAEENKMDERMGRRGGEECGGEGGYMKRRRRRKG